MLSELKISVNDAMVVGGYSDGEVTEKSRKESQCVNLRLNTEEDNRAADFDRDVLDAAFKEANCHPAPIQPTMTFDCCVPALMSSLSERNPNDI
jgi:hypothetical protein